jgi:hypothetical protein
MQVKSKRSNPFISKEYKKSRRKFKTVIKKLELNLIIYTRY